MPFPPHTLLDYNQVIQGAYDEPQRRLRVDAEAVVVGGDLSVDTTHTEDSMRLGDGTSFFTSTYIGPSVGLDVNIINSNLEVNIDHANDSIDVYGTDGATDKQLKTDTDGRLEVIEMYPNTPQIFNISVPLAGTEVSQALPLGTRKFLLRSRNEAARIQLGFGVGDSSTNYIQINRGSNYSSPQIEGDAVTLYFQTSQPSTTVELLAWKRI